MREGNYDNFDRFAENYHSVHTNCIKAITGADSDYFSEYKIQEIKRFEPEDKAGLILDLGCGDGNSEVYFEKYFPSAQIYGIDVSAKSIALAREKDIGRCTFFVYDGENIPFGAETFDIVFISGVLHHVDRKHHQKILEQCRRVLKNGGRIYIFEHNPINPLTQKVVKNCPFDQDAELVSAAGMITVVRKSGFRQIRRKYTIFLLRRSFLKNLLFLERCLSWCPLGGQYYVRAVK